MFIEPFIDKHGKQKYRYVQRYKDPLTNKYKRASVVLNRNGKQSQKEAQRLLDAKIESKIKEASTEDIKDMTFHNLLDEWYNYHKATSGCKVTSLETLSYHVKMIKEAIDKDILLLSVNKKIAQSVVDKGIEKGISDRGIAKRYGTFKRAMHYANAQYNIGDLSYLEYVTIPKKSVTRDEVKAKEENYLTLDQVKEISEYLISESNNKKFATGKRSVWLAGNIALFQMLTAMRIGEVLAIENDSIDYDNKTLTIDGTILWTRKGGIIGFKDTTKTDTSNRIIKLDDTCIDILKRVQLENKKLKQWDEKYNDRGFVFTNLKGNPTNYVNVSKYLQEGAKACAINKHISSHTLRHSGITLLAELNIPLKQIMQRVGHSDYRTTISIYQKATAKMEEETINKLNALA